MAPWSGMGGSRPFVRPTIPGLLIVSAIGLAGCDLVFDFERDPPPEFENYDRCGAFLYDEPLRYAAIANPTGGVDASGNPLPVLPWSWEDARFACQLRGMDLAVFNDLHELGMAPEAAAWPYWIGQQGTGTATQTVDGCPAIDTPAALRLVAADASACGVVAGPLEVTGASCDGVLPAGMEPAVVPGALCETPRPDHLDCLGRDPTTVTYVMSDDAMAYDAATSFCAARSGHLVVFETHDEWRYLSKQTHDRWERPFWVGAQLDGTQWTAVNGCYGTYSWTGGTPGKPSSGSCVTARTRIVDEAEPELSGTVLDGVEPTPCGDEKYYALCELE